MLCWPVRYLLRARSADSEWQDRMRVRFQQEARQDVKYTKEQWEPGLWDAFLGLYFAMGICICRIG